MFYDPHDLTTPRNIPSPPERSKATSRTRRTDHSQAGRTPFLPAFAARSEATEGAFNSAAAESGKVLFNDKARCATCHVPPIFTEPGWNLHTAEEIGIDDFQAMRAPDERYRTVPLRALWDVEKIHKGGFYHDGRFATLRDVVEHYNTHFGLNLTDQEKSDLSEYLKSI